MRPASETLAALDALKAKHDQATRAHAVATSQHEQAQRTVEKAEATLRSLGIDPANAETQLAAELATLETQVADCSKELDACVEQYKGIDTEFRKIGQ